MCRLHKKKVEGYGGGAWVYGLIDESRPEKWGDNCAESFTGPNWFQAARGKRIPWRNIPSPVSEPEYDLFTLSDDEPEPEPEPEQVPAQTAHKHRPGRPGSYHMMTNVRKMIVNHNDNPQPNPTDWVLQEEWTDV